MLITKTVTKKILETIVEETFSKFGAVSSSSLLDSLKLLGFHYATNAGISINIEDLKTPDVKRKFIQTANEEIDFVSQQWQQGFVSDTERFQSIIDSWNVATESLKDKIVAYYQNFDPANNLYIMAFSGARGNMSQVRQLVGLRGLMSDQEGKIIDLPIQANFREGLSSIDYIISSYGARKGIVDTALKTADSGYLTRRLIYIAQDLIIRENDCKTKKGVLLLLKKNSNIKNLIGRNLISLHDGNVPFLNISNEEKILDQITLQKLREQAPLILNVRSSLICESNGSICQKCYGWDLAHNKHVSLGEAVGIIAAQSIGEPGTQLTMRTFHTGGIFTGETLRQVRSSFSGIVILPDVLKTTIYRTNHGTVVQKLLQEATIQIITWDGIKKEIFLDLGAYLYVKNSSFVKKNQLISEYSSQSSIPGQIKLKPVSSMISGEIKFESLQLCKVRHEEKKIKVNIDDGVLWIASGKIFPLPIEVKYLFPKYLKKTKPFAILKLVSPFRGIIKIKNKTLFINNNRTIELENLSKVYPNSILKISYSVKNYQYIDEGTVIGYLEVYSMFNERIYAIRQKIFKNICTLFTILESDVWKINSDQLNNFNILNSKIAVRSGNRLNKNTTYSQSGYFLEQDGLKMIFQRANPIFLRRGTIVNNKKGDFVFKNKILASLRNYNQQTEDIVQGLPKIEELIEARRPKLKAHLAKNPGVILKCETSQTYSNSISSNLFNCEAKQISDKLLEKVVKDKKQYVELAHSSFNKNELVVWNNKIFKIHYFPNLIEHTEDVTKVANIKKFKVSNLKHPKLKQEKIRFEILPNSVKSLNENSNIIYKYKNNQLSTWKKINLDEVLKGKIDQKSFTDYYKMLTVDDEQLILERVLSVSRYTIPSDLQTFLEPGTFIDIGEPLSQGIIDVHELLSIFFHYHVEFDGLKEGVTRSLNKFQLLLVNSIQAIYQSQGVNISSKHIEIIVRQMTSKAVIIDSGDTPLIQGELIRLSLLREIHKALTEKASNNRTIMKTPQYEPVLISTTNSSLNKDGFLSAAGFQETKRMLAKASIEGSTDWLRGLKESIIIGRIIPAGSSFLNYKSYLDNIYLFKNKN
jgi:hypothetical protein